MEHRTEAPQAHGTEHWTEHGAAHDGEQGDDPVVSREVNREASPLPADPAAPAAPPQDGLGEAPLTGETEPLPPWVAQDTVDEVPTSPDTAPALPGLPVVERQVEDLPIVERQVEDLPVVERQVEAPLTGQAAALTPHGASTQHRALTAAGPDRAAPAGLSRRGSVRVGLPVGRWPAPDAEPVQRTVSPTPAHTTSGSATTPGLPDHPPLRTLVPLHRMFAGDPEPLAGDDGTPRFGSDPEQGPGPRPRLGVGLPLPGTSGPSRGGTGPTWAPVQRTAYPDAAGPDTGDAGQQLSPGSLPGSTTSGFTEVILQRSAAAPAPADDDDVAEPGGGTGGGAGLTPVPDPVAALPSGRALDELVERIYEPLTARLRTELWLDRERSGLMVDLRR